ncbi:acyl-CoA synthetase [Tistrella bauzanensis]
MSMRTRHPMGPRFHITGIVDVERIEREMPLSERIAFTSTYDVLRWAADAYGDAPALSLIAGGTADEFPRTLGYQAFFKAVTRTANGLASLGVGRGDGVALLMPNLPETHLAIWGAEAVGIAAPINPLLGIDQIAEIAEAADARVIVAPGPMAGSDLWEKALAAAERLPAITTVLKVGGGPVDMARHPKVRDFAELLASSPDDAPVGWTEPQPDDVCAYFHTGGTTGTPKLARHLHRNQIYMGWVLARFVDMSPADCTLSGLPLFHVNAVHVSGLAPFMAGAHVVLASPAGYRNPAVIQNFWRLVERFRVTMFSTVPTVCTALMQVPVAGADLSSLRFAVVGAAPLPVEVIRNFEALTGIRILEGYGLTEGTCASAVNPAFGQPVAGSVGIRFPYQDMKAVIVDSDGAYLRDAAVDEIGVLCLKGPNAIGGYKQERFNKGLFVADGWVSTGDLARIDAQGRIFLAGRAKDLIIRGGHNIDPQSIEDVLHAHPAVALAGAVGRPDAYAGEIPIAYVTLKPGTTVTAEALKDWARERVSERPAAPAEVIILDEMPVTAIGKIFKPTLRYMATDRVYAGELAGLAHEHGLSATVVTGQDGSHGTAAIVTLRRADGSAVPEVQRPALTEAVGHVLGRFPVSHRVAFG